MILIACGMKTEAAILNNPTNAVVVQGKNNDASLRSDLQAAVDRGEIRGVMSVGVSGGLAPDLRAGDVIVSLAARSGADLIFSPVPWITKILSSLNGVGSSIVARSGVIAYSSDVVATSAEKKSLRGGLHASADAVDMETWIAAQVAFSNRLPFVAVRSISDPSDFDLPPAAIVAMSETGAIDVAAVVRSLVFDDAQIPALLRLDDYATLAFNNLASAMLSIGTEFGFPS